MNKYYKALLDKHDPQIKILKKYGDQKEDYWCKISKIKDLVKITCETYKYKLSRHQFFSKTDFHMIGH